MAGNLDEVYQTQAEYYIEECFDLAKNALGRTSPNPLVGAIVLDKNGAPVGKGYHKKAGLEHAEVVAIKEAGDKASGGTLIVNLEPCCHFGKTPPCTDLIIKSKISQVIFSNHDPNPLVNRNGEKKLLESNIKVLSGVLEKEGLELNKFFFKWVKTKSPWVTLKQAQTLDGKVGILNSCQVSITSERARHQVHLLRNQYDAILVGAKTVICDNPKLTVRGVEGGRNPARVILDVNLTTNPIAEVFKETENTKVYLVTKIGQDKKKLDLFFKTNSNLEVIEIPEISNSRLDLKLLFSALAEKNILSILVEAGPSLASELILNNLIDEYILFIAPRFLCAENSIDSLRMRKSNFEFKIIDHKLIGNDLMIILRK